MAYETGTVNSLPDINTTIRTFLVANGWTWDSGNSTIYKDSMYIKLFDTTNYVYYQASTALTGGEVAPYVGMGLPNVITATPTPSPITFPATYFAFLNADEFYFVINYNSTLYQYVCWGKSTMDVGGGTGTFISASLNYPRSTLGGNYGSLIGTFSDGTYSYLTNFPTSSAPFYGQSYYASHNSSADYVHTDFVDAFLQSNNWYIGDSTNSYTSNIGNMDMSALISVQPNIWNGEAVFLPIRCYKKMQSNKTALVLDLQTAKQCRIDNFADKEEVTLGTDTWKIFPFFQRDMTQRNGPTAAKYLYHSGTFGWAIKKEI